MVSKQCFEKGCELEVDCLCTCSSPKIYMCGSHLRKQLKLVKKKHILNAIFVEPCKGTKDTILDLLAKEKSKKQKLKKKLLDSYSQNLKSSASSLEETLKKIKVQESEINNWMEMICQAQEISKLEEDPALKALSLPPESAVKIFKEILPVNPESYSSSELFWELGEEIRDKIETIIDKECFEKRIEEQDKSINAIQIQSNPKDFNKKTGKNQDNASQSLISLNLTRPAILSKSNDIEREHSFACPSYQSNYYPYNQPLCQINRHQTTSLYLTYNMDNRAKFFIYDTENHLEEVKYLDPPLFESRSSITQLPNGDLFCSCAFEASGATFIVDKNCRIRVLPTGTPCFNSSSLYFNRNVYCFGGQNNNEDLFLSRKFDFDENRWVKLTPIPRADSYCHSVIFNRNILISGLTERNLLQYSIDLDSFSTISYSFAYEKRKILVNTERLYLIECNGLIYESEVGDEYTWKPIAKSIINKNDYYQVNCSFSNGGFYISTLQDFRTCIREYYKFDLDQKVLIDISYYNAHVILRRSSKDFKTVEHYDKNFKLISDHPAGCTIKRNSLNYIGSNLEEIEWCNERIKSNGPSVAMVNENKGELLYNIGRYNEAIECYNESNKHFPQESDTYFNVGMALDALERHHEAVECYNKAIKVDPKNSAAFFSKGKSFFATGRYLEALECYNEAIRLKTNFRYLYFGYRGLLLNHLGREMEAAKDFKSACNTFINKHSLRYITDEETNQTRFKLLQTLSKFQQSAVKFKEGLQKLKDAIKKFPELIKEIEEKEATVKAQHSYILSRAIDSLDHEKNDSIEEMQQIEMKAIEHQRKKFNILVLLCLTCEIKGALVGNLFDWNFTFYR